jgi:hypothetical protein
MARTAAWVNIYISDNATFQDAFQFVAPAGFSIAGMSFEMSVKASRDDVTPLVTFTSAAGQIVITPIGDVINFNVPDSTIVADTPPGVYDYDLVMFDASSPPIRTLMMQGKFIVTHGVTET